MNEPYSITKVSEHEGSGLAYVKYGNRDIFYCPTCYGHERVCPMQPESSSGWKLDCSDPKCGTVVVFDNSKRPRLDF